MNPLYRHALASAKIWLQKAEEDLAILGCFHQDFSAMHNEIRVLLRRLEHTQAAVEASEQQRPA